MLGYGVGGGEVAHNKNELNAKQAVIIKEKCEERRIIIGLRASL